MLTENVDTKAGGRHTGGQAVISIVVPHLNQEWQLERCLSALSAQSADIPGVEIIVVDNGSRSLPVELCSRFPYVNLVQESTPGPGPARNRGIAEAAADTLLFIDADCRPHAQWLKTAVEHFARAGSADIIGGDVRIDVVDEKSPTALEAYESVFAYRQKMYIEKLGFSGTGNLAMRRKAYESVGHFAGIGVAEDRDWGQRATAKGYKIQFIKDMIVYHPARKTMVELQKKWDRHVSHDFQQYERNLSGSAKWFFLTGAVAASGVIDIQKIIRSDRISTFRERLLAAEILLKIRLYRSWRMLTLLIRPSQQISEKWNRG